MIDVDDLAAALLRAGLAEKLAERIVPRMTPRELLTRDELGAALRVSPVTVDRLAREGMPREYIGDLPRFDLAACRAWLADHPRRSAAPSRPSHHDEGPIRRITKRRP